MGYQIKRAMVVGSGVMGGGIAGHLANAGLSVYLVDVVPPQTDPGGRGQRPRSKSPVVRTRIVNQGMDFLRIETPGAFSPTRLELIQAGNIGGHWDSISKRADSIIEVVVENLNIKHQVMAKIEESRNREVLFPHQHLWSAYRADSRRPVG